MIPQGLELPDNLPSYLQTLSPDVTVDEDGGKHVFVAY